MLFLHFCFYFKFYRSIGSIFDWSRHWTVLYIESQLTMYHSILSLRSNIIYLIHIHESRIIHISMLWVSDHDRSLYAREFFSLSVVCLDKSWSNSKIINTSLAVYSRIFLHVIVMFWIKDNCIRKTVTHYKGNCVLFTIRSKKRREQNTPMAKLISSPNHWQKKEQIFDIALSLPPSPLFCVILGTILYFVTMSRCRVIL